MFLGGQNLAWNSDQSFEFPIIIIIIIITAVISIFTVHTAI